MNEQQLEVKAAYDMGYKAGYEACAVVKNHDINDLNARLLERQEAFNVADRRRVARIQELEDQLRLKEVELESMKEAHDELMKHW